MELNLTIKNGRQFIPRRIRRPRSILHSLEIYSRIVLFIMKLHSFLYVKVVNSTAGENHRQITVIVAL